MTTHTLHDDILTHGLDPTCPRCVEHSEHPLGSLDTANLQRLADGTWLTELDRIAADRMGIQRAEMEMRP